MARALCRPLVDDGSGLATYDAVAETLGITRRQARRAVGRLCEHYADFLAADPGDAAAVGYEHLARVLVRRGLVPSGDDADG